MNVRIFTESEAVKTVGRFDGNIVTILNKSGGEASEFGSGDIWWNGRLGLLVEVSLNQAGYFFPLNFCTGHDIARGLKKDRAVDGFDRHHLKQDLNRWDGQGNHGGVLHGIGAIGHILKAGKGVNNIFLQVGLEAIAEGRDGPILIQGLHNVILQVA